MACMPRHTTRLQTGRSWTGCSTSEKRQSRAPSRFVRQALRIASTRTRALSGTHQTSRSAHHPLVVPMPCAPPKSSPRGETGGTEPFILHVRTRNRPDAIIRPVESALRANDSRLPFFEIHTLAEGCRPSRSCIRPGGLFRSVLRWGRCDRYATRFGEHLRSVILDAPFASSRSPDGSWVKIFHDRC